MPPASENRPENCLRFVCSSSASRPGPRRHDYSNATRTRSGSRTSRIDRWTRYRSRDEIFSAYDRYFDNELRERDYIRYRLLDDPSSVRRMLARTVEWPVISHVEVALFRKLAFLVIFSRKR